MQKVEFVSVAHHWTRISKRKARQFYEAGKTIRVVPHKYRPDNKWLKMDFVKREESYGFNSRVESFEYYNCNFEVGYYSAFYIDEREGQ